MALSTKLKKCPFCGSNPQVIEGIIGRGANSSGKLPSGATFVSESTSPDGESHRYYWERRGYIVTCSNITCICRSKRPRFDTLEKAATTWNHRIKDWEY